MKEGNTCTKKLYLCVSQVVQGISDVGARTSKDSKVNFIVPHRNILQEEKKCVNATTKHLHKSRVLSMLFG